MHIVEICVKWYDVMIKKEKNAYSFTSFSIVGGATHRTKRSDSSRLFAGNEPGSSIWIGAGGKYVAGTIYFDFI